VNLSTTRGHDCYPPRSLAQGLYCVRDMGQLLPRRRPQCSRDYNWKEEHLWKTNKRHADVSHSTRHDTTCTTQVNLSLWTRYDLDVTTVNTTDTIVLRCITNHCSVMLLMVLLLS